MADNLFKNSDPACRVPEVPVVDLRFVEDCFITPTPPPVFECVQPAVPNEPCVFCPTFNTTTNVDSGYCVTEPKTVITLEKVGDNPCEYDFNLDIEIPIPRPPCPEINVTGCSLVTLLTGEKTPTDTVGWSVSDDLSTNSSGGSSGGSGLTCANDILLGDKIGSWLIACLKEKGWYADGSAGRDPEPAPVGYVGAFKASGRYGDWSYYLRWRSDNNNIIAIIADNNSGVNKIVRYAATSAPWLSDEFYSYIRLFAPPTGSLSLLAPDACADGGCRFQITPNVIRGNCDTPDQCTFDVELDLKVPVPRVPCPVIKPTKIDVTTSYSDCKNKPSTVTVINKHTPGDCTTQDKCEFDIEIEINVPIPRPPCPLITAKSCALTSVITGPRSAEGADCSKTATSATKNSAAQTTSSDCIDAAPAPPCDTTGCLFQVTPHITPGDCNTPDQCEFDIELDLKVPVPRVPCPVINPTKIDVTTTYDDSTKGCNVKPSSITIINKHTPGDCTTQDQCEFDIELEINVPIPPVPCPKINGKLDVKTGYAGSGCTGGGSRLTIEEKTTPGDCNTPDQCEFDIDLVIDIPIPRVPCPIINVSGPKVTVAYEDSNCLDCKGDVEVDSFADIEKLDKDKRAAGTRISIKNPINQYEWTGSEWRPAGETRTPSDPKNKATVDTWTDLQKSWEIDGFIVKFINPPKYFRTGIVKRENDKYVYQWLPNTTATYSGGLTFTTAAARDEYFADKLVMAEGGQVTLTNPPTQYIYDARPFIADADPNSPYTDRIGWVGYGFDASDNSSNSVTVTDEEALKNLDTKDIAVGTIATLTSPTTVYTIGDDGAAVATPCSQNKFSITTKHTPGTGCNDPGQCEFDIALDIIVPIPKPEIPCPEINVTSFDVKTTTKECAENEDNKKDCTADKAVSTLKARDAIPEKDRKEGMVVLVRADKKFYRYDGSAWAETDASAAGKCCANSFTITGRKEDNTIKKVLGNKTELDTVDGIEAGQVVAVPAEAGGQVKTKDELNSLTIEKAPVGTIIELVAAKGKSQFFKRDENGNWVPVSGRQYFRKNDEGGWDEVNINENDCAAGDTTKCVFDVDLNICVPLPDLCPTVNSKSKVTAAYKKCVECLCDVTVADKASLPKNAKPGTFACLSDIKHFYKYSGGKFTTVNSATDIAWYVFEEDDLKDLPSSDKVKLVDGDIVKVEFPLDRWYLEPAVPGVTEGGWKPARCAKNEFRVIAQKKKTEKCDEPAGCALHFFIDTAVPIPPPACPTFLNGRVNANSYYIGRQPDGCKKCPADVEVYDIGSLTALGPIGTGSPVDCASIPTANIAVGTTAFVRANGSLWRWFPHFGGWIPGGTSCNSAIVIAPRPVCVTSCDSPPVCAFDISADINIAIPPPPCPIFNTRRSDVKMCDDTSYPRTSIVMQQRVEEPGCAENCAKKGCIFDFDFQLEIPCPRMTGGTIKVIPVNPGDDTGGTFYIEKGCGEADPEIDCDPPPSFTVLDAVERDRLLYRLGAGGANLGGLTVAAFSSNADGSPRVDYYTYAGGAECGEPTWSKNTNSAASYSIAASSDIEAKTALKSVVFGAMGQSGSLNNLRVKTTQPLPYGAVWDYVGGLEYLAPQWREVRCDSQQKKPLCEFQFNAAIAVPFCTPKMEEDDDQGTHTGIKKEDRVKVYYIKPDEECPNPDPSQSGGQPCPDPDTTVPNAKARDRLLGEPVGVVRGQIIDVNGIPRLVSVPVVPGMRFGVAGQQGIYYVITDTPAGQPGPWVDISARQCRAVGQQNALPPCPKNIVYVSSLAAINQKRGTKPNQNITNGIVVKTADDGKTWRLRILGDQIPFYGLVGGWAEALCDEDVKARMVVAPDSVDKCKLRYAMQVIICNRQPNHIATCTQYFGADCCDDVGCPCGTDNNKQGPDDCCDRDARDDVDDGSKDIGNPYYPSAQNFTAVDTDSAARTYKKTLPRLAVGAASSGDGEEPEDNPATENFDVDPDDACVSAAQSAGEDCTDEGDDEIPDEDYGYRPYKSLELRVKEIYQKDRLKPPKVKHYIEAAMNCLHGTKFFVKKGARPTAAFSMPPEAVETTSADRPIMASHQQPGEDDIGEGTVYIHNNRIKMDITLYTEECSSSSSSSSSSEFTALPETNTLETVPTELPTLASTANGAAGINAEFPPQLLDAFIRAINTNPELKAAIRQVVNQPD